jgi:hypothetical protein
MFNSNLINFNLSFINNNRILSVFLGYVLHRAKSRLHELMQQDRDFAVEDREKINPGNALSISTALDFVKNPVKCCERVQDLIQRLMDIVRIKKDDPKTKGMDLDIEQ